MDKPTTDIRRGSKSFALASLAFGRRERHAAWALYAWCRFADDEVDEAHDPKAGLRELEVALEREQGDYPWPGFFALMREYRIPKRYAADLLLGFEMDVEKRVYRNREDLLDYCYCVAGTVGLMMSHVMGLRRPEALSNAVALGQAMQLTNVARDVMEDWARGRVYVPGVLDPYADPSATKRAVDDLLDHAELLYARGLDGVRDLRFRAAIAVTAALFIYREIGRRIRRGSASVLQTRVVISKPRKLLLFTLATGRVLLSLPSRLRRPFRRAPELPVWRHRDVLP